MRHLLPRRRRHHCLVLLPCLILAVGCDDGADVVPPEPAATRPATRPADAALPRRDGMVRVPGGSFRMGNDDPAVGEADEEGPVVTAVVPPLWVDEHEVTNAQFAAFVDATGYVTVAERAPDPKDFPGAPPEALVPGSLVFNAPARADLRGEISQWWAYVPGANWRHPEGPGSDLTGRDKHPVVHVCLDDARAYCTWAKKRLPTEAEWEHAARGGLDGKVYAWGDEFQPGDRPMANTWQGTFPVDNTLADGFFRTAPVESFPPNGYGLYDVAGNVWEWTTTPWQVGHATPERSGPSPASDAPATAERVMKGGSFLCAPNYCRRYRPAARSRTTPDSGLSNLGFRCVRDVGDAADATRP